MGDPLIENLEALLAKGTDNPGLRLALASRYLASGNSTAAVRHAEAAVALDPQYSAGWKALGRAHEAGGAAVDATHAYERGIAVAEERGDQQAAKEMRVFVRRLAKAAPR